MKLFIFGSTGDLVKRKVLPALQSLNKDNLEIVAIGRKDFTHEIYHDFVCEGDRCSPRFKKILKYIQVDFEKEDICEGNVCRDMFDKKQNNFIYISMPPWTIIKILLSLSKMKKEGFDFSILIEKPLGENLEQAIELKKIINENNLDVFLSDHYMFKKNVINLNKQKFEKLKIVSAEELGLEKRAGYYDSVGALKDMVQSHFLNIAFRLLNNPEKEFSDFEIKEYKKAQYLGYVKELGKESNTETFVKLKIKTKNKEFEFISGKKFSKKTSFLEIDNKKIELETGDNPYEIIFSDFFNNKKEKFPKIDEAILAWEIIRKIESQKTELKFYEDDSSYDLLI